MFSCSTFSRAIIIALYLILFSGSFSGVAVAQITLTAAEIAELRSQSQTAFAEKRNQDALNFISRVVVSEPTNLKARFFRAQILVAMGRGGEIREELMLMSRLKLPQSEIDKALLLIEVIDKSERRLSLTALIKLGIGSTDNVNSWPKGGFRTSGGSEFPLPDAVNNVFMPIDETLTEGTISLNGIYEISENRDLKVNFGFSTSSRNGQDTVNADRKYISMNGSLQKDFGSGYSVKAGYFIANLDRVNDKDGTDVSTDIATKTMSFEGFKLFDNGITIGYRFTNSSNDHSKLSTANLSDSIVDTHSIYAGSLVGKTAYIRGTLSFAEAKSDHLNDIASNVQKSKDRVNKETPSASLLVVKILPYGQRLNTSLSYSDSEFEQQEVNTGVLRNDKTTSLSLGYAVNAETVWKPLKGFVFGIDGSYLKTKSNQASARVTSKKYMVSLSRKFQL